jgi:hypothetical protein
VLPAWEEDFVGDDAQSIALNTVELQFEVQVTDWARSSLVVEYDSASDVVFTTTEDDEFSVDRFNVDTAFLTLGNAERFPPYLKLGRMVVPFGISTGDPVADVLSIVDPLTVEVFETRRDAMLFGFEFCPAPDPERGSRRRPRSSWSWLRSSALARSLGYRPFLSAARPGVRAGLCSPPSGPASTSTTARPSRSSRARASGTSGTTWAPWRAIARRGRAGPTSAGSSAPR